MLSSTGVLQLLPRAVLHNSQEFQLDALFDCLVGIVRADGVVVDPLLLAVTTGKVRQVMEQVNDCVRLALTGGAVGSDLWPSGWWRSLEFEG
jgi:hypothetical protein